MLERERGGGRRERKKGKEHKGDRGRIRVKCGREGARESESSFVLCACVSERVIERKEKE